MYTSSLSIRATGPRRRLKPQRYTISRAMLLACQRQAGGALPGEQRAGPPNQPASSAPGAPNPHTPSFPSPISQKVGLTCLLQVRRPRRADVGLSEHQALGAAPGHGHHHAALHVGPRHNRALQHLLLQGEERGRGRKGLADWARPLQRPSAPRVQCGRQQTQPPPRACGRK